MTNGMNDTTNTASNTATGAQQTSGAWYAAGANTYADNAAGNPAANTASGPYIAADANVGVPTKRMLYRAPSDKLIAGVCGGVAEYLHWNPVLVRVFWVVATFATWGGGILAYVLLALFLPTGDNTRGQMKPPALELSQKGMTYAAGALMGLGGLWLLANLGILPGLWSGFWGLIGILFWPVLLIGAGYLLLRANSQKDIDREIANAAGKVRSAMGDKMPSGDQVKSGFTTVRDSLPLRRSTTNRMIFGVCGGIADKYGIDANLIRLIWAAFALGTMGLGALLYAAIGLLLPMQDAQQIVPAKAAAENVQNITIVDGNAQRVD